jgi:multiple sugar transport system substrate-binding protein
MMTLKRSCFSAVFLLSLLLSLGSSANLVQGQSPVEIRWRTRPSSEKEQAAYQAINDAINEKLTDIEVIYDPSPVQGYEDRLLTELSSGTAPDIVWVPGATFSSYASRNVFVDLAPLLEADPDLAPEDFFAAVIDEMQHEGTLYGLPRDVGTMVVYYNVDMFEAAGLPTPLELQAEGNWTWETMYASALALTNNTDNAEEVTWGLTIPFWWGTYLNLVGQAGGSLFNADRTECALNSPATTETFTFLNRIYNGDGTNPPVSPPPGSDADAGPLFLNGKVGMRWDGRWVIPTLRALATMDWEVIELPSGSAGQANSAFWGAYAITRSSKNVDAAYQVLRELVSSESQSALMELGTIMPSLNAENVLENFLAGTPPTNNAAYVNAMEYATPEQSPWNINMNTVLYAILAPEAERVIAGEITPEEFTASICDQINAEFE